MVSAPRSSPPQSQKVEDTLNRINTHALPEAKRAGPALSGSGLESWARPTALHSPVEPAGSNTLLVTARKELNSYLYQVDAGQQPRIESPQQHEESKAASVASPNRFASNPFQLPQSGQPSKKGTASKKKASKKSQGGAIDLGTKRRSSREGRPKRANSKRKSPKLSQPTANSIVGSALAEDRPHFSHVTEVSPVEFIDTKSLEEQLREKSELLQQITDQKEELLRLKKLTDAKKEEGYSITFKHSMLEQDHPRLPLQELVPNHQVPPQRTEHVQTDLRNTSSFLTASENVEGRSSALSMPSQPPRPPPFNPTQSSVAHQPQPMYEMGSQIETSIQNTRLDDRSVPKFQIDMSQCEAGSISHHSQVPHMQAEEAEEQQRRQSYENYKQLKIMNHIINSETDFSNPGQIPPVIGSIPYKSQFAQRYFQTKQEDHPEVPAETMKIENQQETTGQQTEIRKSAAGVDDRSMQQFYYPQSYSNFVGQKSSNRKKRKSPLTRKHRHSVSASNTYMGEYQQYEEEQACVPRINSDFAAPMEAPPMMEPELIQQLPVAYPPEVQPPAPKPETPEAANQKQEVLQKQIFLIDKNLHQLKKEHGHHRRQVGGSTVILEAKPAGHRLFEMAKFYQAKKQAIIEHRQQAEKLQEEEQMRSFQRRSKSSVIMKRRRSEHPTSFYDMRGRNLAEGGEEEDTKLKVEDRLMEVGKQYRSKKELLKYQRQLKEVQSVQAIPSINKNTLKILMNDRNKKINGKAFVNMPVHSRLLKLGSESKRAIQHKRMLSKIDEELAIPRRPKSVGATERELYPSRMGKHKLRDFIEKQNLYSMARQQKLQVLSHIHQPQFGFNPEIDPKSSRMASLSKRSAERKRRPKSVGCLYSAEKKVQRRTAASNAKTQIQQQLEEQKKRDLAPIEQILAEYYQRNSEVSSELKSVVQFPLEVYKGISPVKGGPAGLSDKKLLPTHRRRKSLASFQTVKQKPILRTRTPRTCKSMDKTRPKFSSPPGDEQPRWQRLYDEHKRKESKLANLKAKWHRKSLPGEDSECTFKPAINRSARHHQSVIVLPTAQSDREAGDPLFDRQMVWKQNVQQKKEELRIREREKQQKECPFRPQIKQDLSPITSDRQQEKADYSHIHYDSVQKHLLRQWRIRKAKIQQELEESKRAGSGKVWSSQLTRPVTPNVLKKSCVRGQAHLPTEPLLAEKKGPRPGKFTCLRKKRPRSVGFEDPLAKKTKLSKFISKKKETFEAVHRSSRSAADPILRQYRNEIDETLLQPVLQNRKKEDPPSEALNIQLKVEQTPASSDSKTFEPVSHFAKLYERQQNLISKYQSHRSSISSSSAHTLAMDSSRPLQQNLSRFFNQQQDPTAPMQTEQRCSPVKPKLGKRLAPQSSQPSSSFGAVKKNLKSELRQMHL